MIRRILFLLVLSAALSSLRAASAFDGYRLYEGTAASVNKEVLFLSDVIRERCLLSCAAMPGVTPEELSFAEARDRLIADTLALQEHRKLALGQVDDAVLAKQVEEALARMSYQNERRIVERAEALIRERSA